MTIVLARVLLMEGPNDVVVVGELLKRKGRVFASEKRETWPVKPCGSYEAVLNAISGTIKAMPRSPGSKSCIGIVVDADEDQVGRWTSIRDKLTAEHGNDVTKMPLHPTGAPVFFESVGTPGLHIAVWMMPNNGASVGSIESLLLSAASRQDLVSYVDQVTPIGVKIWEDRPRTVNQMDKAKLACYRAFGPHPDASYGKNVASQQMISHANVAVASFTEWVERVLFPDSSD